MDSMDMDGVADAALAELRAEVRRLRAQRDRLVKAAADALDGGNPDALVDTLDEIYRTR